MSDTAVFLFALIQKFHSEALRTHGLSHLPTSVVLTATTRKFLAEAPCFVISSN